MVQGPNNLLRDAPDAFEIIGFEEKQKPQECLIKVFQITTQMIYTIQESSNFLTLKFIDPDLNRWTTENADYSDWN